MSMQKEKVPNIDSLEDLVFYIESLENEEHDYNTSGYATAMAAVAAFNYMAGRLGLTGFQASYAELDFIRRTRNLNCPFMLIKADNMLYPQYNILEDVKHFLKESQGWAKEEALKKINEENSYVHPDVYARWKELAGI